MMAEISQSIPAPGVSGAGDEASVRLPFVRKIGFGIGDFAFNLYWQSTTLYLLYYYTDVVGLSPGIAGAIFGGAMLWDAVFDPVMGYVANRTRTRWGRYRPYLLFGCVPLAVSFVSMFVPNRLEGVAQLAFVVSTHVLFRTTYTVLSMPYNALMATLTVDSRERGSLAAYRMVCAATAGVLVALSTLRLVQVLGGGDAKTGFLFVNLAYATVAVCVFVATFLSTKEAVVPDRHGVSIREAFLVIVGNRAFVIVFGFAILHMTSSTLLSKTLPYVLKYGMHREDLIGWALGAVALQVFVSIPFWAWVMRRTSKRRVALIGACITAVCYGLLGAAGLPGLGALLAILVAIGFGNAAMLLAQWAMIPDTVEYGEWRTGIRGEGVIFGVVALAQKAALALAVGAVGQILEAIGFVANRVQSPRTLDGLWAMLWKGPLVFTAMAIGLVLLYPVSSDVHARILGILRLRRSAVR
ncbi:hypothetical protein DIE23_04475 [Burkholderia sp. Bp9143]|nr:hypothetical protein DIE23_04475 [Burkholderia sp. Bp9143]